MATQEFNAPTLTTGGEPCPGCGAELAGDQRYCLQCGTRRGDARLPFRDVLAQRPLGGGYVERTTERIAADPPPTEPRTGLTFLAGLACLLLALGVGVLIGRSGDRSVPAKAAPAQVISVGGAPAAATTPATTDASSSSAKSAKGKKASSKSKVPTAKSAKDSKATNKSLKSLGGLSGKDYQKKAAKLPKQVGTGGKAPPVDKSKPAGGGSAVQSIG